MIITTTENSVDYINSVKTQRRDWFLAAMFLPEPIRESVLTIYALDIELEHVHHMVKEEMMGHIRYAWWQENIEALGSSVAVSNHPLLQLLASTDIKPQSLLPIITAYRESFPNLPNNSEEVIQGIVKQYLACHPALVAGSGIIVWNKATAIITKHRKKYRQKYNGWLLVKLLFV